MNNYLELTLVPVFLAGIMYLFCAILAPYARKPNQKLLDQCQDRLKRAVISCGRREAVNLPTHDQVLAYANSRRSDRFIHAPLIFIIPICAAGASVWAFFTVNRSSVWLPIIFVVLWTAIPLMGVVIAWCYNFAFPELKAAELCGYVITDLGARSPGPFSSGRSFVSSRSLDDHVSQLVQRTSGLVARSEIKRGFPQLLHSKVLTALRMTRDLERRYLDHRMSPNDQSAKYDFLLSVFSILDMLSGISALANVEKWTADERVDVFSIQRREVWLRRAVFASVYAPLVVLLPIGCSVALRWGVTADWAKAALTVLVPLFSTLVALYGLWRKYVVKKQDPFTDLSQTMATTKDWSK